MPRILRLRNFKKRHPSSNRNQRLLIISQHLAILQPLKQNPLHREFLNRRQIELAGITRAQRNIPIHAALSATQSNPSNPIPTHTGNFCGVPLSLRGQRGGRGRGRGGTGLDSMPHLPPPPLPARAGGASPLVGESRVRAFTWSRPGRPIVGKIPSEMGEIWQQPAIRPQSPAVHRLMLDHRDRHLHPLAASPRPRLGPEGRRRSRRS